MFPAGKSRERRISSSCWSWPGERCSIEISPIHTSLGIQVSKILIIFMYNIIYLSLISRNSNPIERDLINIYIYIYYSFLFSKFLLATQRIFVRFDILESNLLYIQREREREREKASQQIKPLQQVRERYYIYCIISRSSSISNF